MKYSKKEAIDLANKGNIMRAIYGRYYMLKDNILAHNCVTGEYSPGWVTIGYRWKLDEKGVMTKTMFLYNNPQVRSDINICEFKEDFFEIM